MTIVISAFPGAGKSTAIKMLTEEGYNVSDSDSTEFNFKMSEDGKSYLDINGDVTYNKAERVKNVNFIDEYMSAIRQRMRENDVIFVSSHGEVREALNDNSIQFVMVGYQEGVKAHVVDRVRNRDSNQPNEDIADALDSNWGSFIAGMYDHNPVEVVQLGDNEFLYDVVKQYI